MNGRDDLDAARGIVVAAILFLLVVSGVLTAIAAAGLFGSAPPAPPAFAVAQEHAHGR